MAERLLKVMEMPDGNSYIFNASKLNDKTYDDIVALINAATNGAVVLKGTLGTGGTITSLDAASASNLGYAYKVITAGTYQSQAAKFGDLFICYKSGTSSYAWMLIPAGDDIEDTWRPIKVGSTTLTDGSTTFEVVAGNNIDLSFSGGKLTIDSSYSDTGATSVEVTGTGNAVTTASYNASTRKITLTKGSTFLTAETDTLQSVTGRGATTTHGITLGSTTPLTFTGVGSGTYTLGMMYCQPSGGIIFETPRASDNATATILPFNIMTRGGQYAPLNSGAITSNSTVTAGGFIHSDTTKGNNNYVLLAGGGAKSLSDFQAAGNFLPLAGGEMKGPITYPVASGNNKTSNYISAGGGYATGSGKQGLKILALDQSDATMGLGVDLTGGPYELTVATSRVSNSQASKIVFATHTVGTTAYKTLATLSASGVENPVVTFNVPGTIQENGTALSSKYLGISAKAADSDKLDGKDSSEFALKTDIPDVPAGKFVKCSYSDTGWSDGPADLDSTWYKENSFMGSVSASSLGWQNLINIRHRGGGGEGDNSSYGMQIRSGLTSSSDRLYYRHQHNGTWYDWISVANLSDCKNPTDYYWANVKVSSSSNTGTTPTFKTATISNGTNSCTISAPNSSTTYGSIAVTGGKGDYCGINFGNTSSRFTIMDDGAHMGIYNGNHGWTYCYEYASGTIGLGGYGNSYSGAQGYKINLHSNTQVVGKIFADQFRGNSWSCAWYQGRDSAVFRNIAVSGYHALWSLKTTNGSWDFGEYSTTNWHNIPVLTYIQDSHYNTNNNTATYQIKFPLASGTIALTSDISDTKVTQAYSTTDSNYPLLFSATAGIASTDSRGATTSILCNKIYANPKTGRLFATNVESSSSMKCSYMRTSYIDGGGPIGENFNYFDTDYQADSIWYSYEDSDTGDSSDYTLYFPKKSGTIALTSDVPSTSSFVTLTGSQNITGKKHFGNSAGSTSISNSLDAIMIGCNTTRSTTSNCYYPGIAFNHMLGYGDSYKTTAHGWIGLRLVDTPGSERSSLVFATKDATGNTGADRPVERMCIDPFGKVGIGTKTPETALHVTGQIKTNSPLLAYAYDGGNGANKAAIVWDKPGSNFTGVGAINSRSDIINFGACDSSGNWITTYDQIWRFNGSLNIKDYFYIKTSVVYLNSSSYTSTGLALPTYGSGFIILQGLVTPAAYYIYSFCSNKSAFTETSEIDSYWGPTISVSSGVLTAKAYRADREANYLVTILYCGD